MTIKSKMKPLPINRTIKRLGLSTALVTILAASTQMSFAGYVNGPDQSATIDANSPVDYWKAENGATLNVEPGGETKHITADDSVVNVDGGTINGDAQAMSFSGSIGIIKNSNITAGPNSFGFFIKNSTAGNASVVSISDTNITAGSRGFQLTGDSELNLENSTVKSGSIGISIFDNSSAKVTNSTIETTKDNGYGIYLAPGTAADIFGSTIITEGDYAHGVYAFGAGVDITDTDIITKGEGARGIYATNDSIVDANNVNISTEGFNSVGADLSGAKTVLNMTGGSITTTGELAVGVRASADAIANLDGVDIHVSGKDADGVWAQSGGTINVKNSNIVTDHASTHAVWAQDGTVNISNTNITTNGEYARGLFVSDNGVINADHVSINTGGDRSHGIQMSSGEVAMHNSSIKTTGKDALGVWNTGGKTDLIDTTVETHGAGAHGIVVADNGLANAVNVSVKTTGDHAYGAVAGGTDAKLNIYGGSYETSGFRGVGVEAKNGAQVVIDRDPRTGAGTKIHTTGDSGVGVRVDTGGTAYINGAEIITEGGGSGSEWAVGVLAANSGTATVIGTKITTHGLRGDGLNATSDGSHIEMSGGSITTTGLDAKGAVAYDGGTATLTNVDIVTESGRGVVAADDGSWLVMNGGSILTKGASASAAQAVRGAKTILNGVRLTTEGADAIGAHAFGAGSAVEVNSSEITTNGSGGHGALASVDSSVNIDASRITTSGSNAHGLVTNMNGSINVTDSSVKVTGIDSSAIYSKGDTGTSEVITVDGSVLESENGSAIEVASGNLNLNVKGSHISGNGTLLNVANAATAKLEADKSTLIGDINVADGSTADIGLKNNSYLRGAIKNGTSASIDATSAWSLTGSSDIAALDHAGIIDFDAENPYKTLTVGSYNGDGGSFYLNTKLNEGGSASETDKVIVDGDATGNGKVFIKNNGGAGANTGTGATDGIQIIEVAGNSDASFQLGAAAIVGIYDYQLVKADGQNWYLQTEGNDPTPPCEDTNTCPIDPPTGHIVDLVPGYNIALSAAQTHVLTTLDTFHERVGELRSEEMKDGFNAWTRAIGKAGSYKPGISGYNGGGFDMTTAGVQIGGDYSLGGVFIPGDKLTFGLFGEYAHSNFDVNGRSARGSISSKGIGGYATWQQNAPTETKAGTGAYVDAVVKRDWLDFGVSAKSVSGFDLNSGYKGRATTASIETGYGFDLGNNVVLQPQAQLTYSKVKANSFTDGYGIALHSQQAESLIGRVGVRLEKTFFLSEDTVETSEQVLAAPLKSVKDNKPVRGKVAPTVLPAAPKKKFTKTVTTYVDANVKREFKGKNGLVASDTAIGSDMSGTRYDVGAGIVARVSENVSLYGRGSVEFGGSTKVAGKVSGGLKITW